MKMEFIADYIAFSVSIDDDVFTKNMNDGLDLYDALEAIDGVTGVDYDGHFGAFVFFSVDLDVDVPATLEKIKNTIGEMWYGKVPEN